MFFRWLAETKKRKYQCRGKKWLKPAEGELHKSASNTPTLYVYFRHCTVCNDNKNTATTSTTVLVLAEQHCAMLLTDGWTWWDHGSLIRGCALSSNNTMCTCALVWDQIAADWSRTSSLLWCFLHANAPPQDSASVAVCRVAPITFSTWESSSGTQEWRSETFRLSWCQFWTVATWSFDFPFPVLSECEGSNTTNKHYTNVTHLYVFHLLLSISYYLYSDYPSVKDPELSAAPLHIHASSPRPADVSR